MNYIDIINYIEDEPILLLSNPYYHAFKYDSNEFISMITEGIKAPILLGKEGTGNNGPFYVSLSKNENAETSIYDMLKSLPMFVINENIKTFKARNYSKEKPYPFRLTRTPLPFRDCEYDDEYQTFLRVSPKDILAIQYNLFANYLENNEDYIIEQLLTLIRMVENLEKEQINLPIIDTSTSTKINKEKVLSLKLY